MNATQRLIEAAERLHHLHLCEQEGIRSGAPNPVDWYEAVDAIGMALAAAKEEHGKHEICPPHVIYEAVGGGMICSGCEQRFAPANGLDVEGVMRLVNEHDLLLFNTNRGRENFRKALEAYAEKGGDNLRTDTCEPDCRDHGGIEGCSCSECSTPLGPPVFMTYCGGCGRKVNWPEGTDMMPGECAYPQRKGSDPWISVERLKEVRAEVLHNAEGYSNEQVNWCLGVLDELLPPIPSPPDTDK